MSTERVKNLSHVSFFAETFIIFIIQQKPTDMVQKTTFLRRLYVPFLLLATGAAVFFGWKYYALINKGTIAETIDKSRCAPCMEYNKVGNDPKLGKLDMNFVKTLAYNYKYQNGGSAPIQDTRSVWFPIETLKNFIYLIESKSCSCSDSLGIRIYFGKYPVATKWNVFSSDLSALETQVINEHGTNAYGYINTLFMVPTIKTGGVNWDFDPADNTYGCKGGYSEKYLINQKDGPGWFTNNAFGSPITALSAQNHGDACPPPTPPATTCPDEGAYFDY